MNYRELLQLISNPEQKEQCEKMVANKIATYYAENDIDINWLKDNFVCQPEKDEFVNSVKQSLTFLDESLAQTDDLLVSYHFSENEFDLPKALVKHPSLFASVIRYYFYLCFLISLPLTQTGAFYTFFSSLFCLSLIFKPFENYHFISKYGKIRV